MQPGCLRGVNKFQMYWREQSCTISDIDNHEKLNIIGAIVNKEKFPYVSWTVTNILYPSGDYSFPQLTANTL